MAKITLRIWILIIFILLSAISIFVTPNGISFLERGVSVNSVEQNSSIFELGLRQGDIIKQINDNNIESVDDYTSALQPLSELDINKTLRLEIITDSKEIIGLFTPSLINDVSIEEIPNSRLKTGLDLQGGARALVTTENKSIQLTDSDLDDLISTSEERLNVYGLSDVKFSKITSSTGERYMMVEIAGSSPQDLEELIASQGKFEAKIGNETVFTGGNKDITHVGKTGTEAMVTECFATQDGQQACNFRFVVYLSEEAAQRHADITANLSVVDGYLEKQIDFYIDGVKTSSLNIGADLKGNVATQIQISGSGSGQERKQALENAEDEMKKLQAILSTGSLPYKLEIAKLDKISPKLGQQFTQRILTAGLFAIIAVSILIFIRYRKIKVSLALIAVSLSEVLIILGVAATIGWNLDLPSIAGIIAAIGTGIDSQLIILDESQDKHESIKQRIKKALFIIVTAFATTFVALIPLTGFLSFMGIGAASAGLLKGFAVTTLIGITVGVLISRPAFADIARQLEE